jgi:hypothetical protein
MNKKETYKEFKLRVLEGTFGRYLDSTRWGNELEETNAYCDFIGHYKIVKEALESIQDEPHVWVKCAINDMYSTWCEEMDTYIAKGLKV